MLFPPLPLPTTSDDSETYKGDEFYLHIISSCETAEQVNIFIEMTKTFMPEHLASTGHSINYELGANNTFYSILTFIWMHCFINNVIYSVSSFCLYYMVILQF